MASGVLWRGRMNAIAFGTKRAFHGFLRITRKALADMGLTAARFDMMSAILADGRDAARHRGVTQSELRRRLGVTAPVVTRMVKALAALGLVERLRKDYEDRRQRWVRLTEAGEKCILQAQKLLLKPVRRLVFQVICFGRHRDRDQRFVHTNALERYLNALRRDFGDRANLYYPWGHPDD